MASIAVPQVYVYQEFSAVPTEVTQPLRPAIIGPEYMLHKYVQGSSASVGEYDPATGNTFTWDSLGRIPGGVVDQGYTKVFIEEGLLEYFDSDDASVTVTSVDGVRNKIEFDINVAGKTGYPLNTVFSGRAVQVGDTVLITATVDGNPYSHKAKVVRIEADKLPTEIGTAVSALINKATNNSAGPTATVAGSGTQENIEVSGTYNGLASGVLNEVYTIVVKKNSTGLNPSTSVFDIISASGKDSVYGFIPSATDYDTPIPLGNNGLTFNFSEYEVSPLQIGWTWTVSVSQAFTKPTLTSSGTFTGTFNTDYIVKVIRGGDVTAVSASNRPIVQISTSNGSDASPPFVLSDNTFNVGNFGVVGTFDEDELCAGDQYFIPVTGSAEGAYRTVVLSRALPQILVSEDSDIVDLSVKLCITKNLELNQEIFTEAITNWETSSTDLTLESGAREFDSGWKSGDESLPLVGGSVFVHWRQLITTHTDRLYTVTTINDISNVFDSQIDPDNPLVFAVFKALQNSGGTTLPTASVRAIGVSADNVAGYQSAMSTIDTNPDVYCFVPLSDDPAVHNIVVTAVNTLSIPEIADWKLAMLPLSEGDSIPVLVTDLSGNSVEATLDSSGQLEVDSDIDLLEYGVKTGDKIRIAYSKDKYGNEVYDEYVVDFVDTDKLLQVVGSVDSPVATPSRFEVHRDKNAEDLIDYLEAKASQFTNRRVYYVYPENPLRSSGSNVNAFYGSAAVGGLIGASAPQQGLTNTTVEGFDVSTGRPSRFTKNQLNRLAGAGVMILAEDRSNGSMYIRHQLSSDVSDLNNRELSVVKNVDSISFFLHNRIKRFIGRANVTDTAIQVISTELTGGIDFLKSSQISPLTGGQVLEGTAIREIRQHPVLRDRLIIIIDLVIPYPINYIELYLVV